MLWQNCDTKVFAISEVTADSALTLHTEIHLDSLTGLCCCLEQGRL